MKQQTIQEHNYHATTQRKIPIGRNRCVRQNHIYNTLDCAVSFDQWEFCVVWARISILHVSSAVPPLLNLFPLAPLGHYPQSRRSAEVLNLPQTVFLDRRSVRLRRRVVLTLTILKENKGNSQP